MPIIQSGEFLIDDETGEVVNAAFQTPFQIETMEHVEWLHEKLFNLNAEETMLKAKLAAYKANTELMLNENARKREWLERRYFMDAEAVVRENCPKNAKSVKTPFGRAGFQKIGGNLKIAGGAEEAAIEWCKLNAPDAVKTYESVLVSKMDVNKEKLELTVKKGEKTLHIPLDQRIFFVEEETDKFYIK